MIGFGNRYKLVLMFWVFIFGLFSLSTSAYAAAGGARPISLGGAFVAIADDANAATWNPAGLAWQQNRELTYSGIVLNREDYIPGDFISDDYIVYAQPWRANYRGEFDEYGGLGVYFLNSGYENKTSRVKQTIRQPGIAYGRAFGDSNTMSWGVSANLYMYDSVIPGATASDTSAALNVGYLWFLNNNITLGLVIENINEPTIALHGVTSRIVRVWRPAIAYYFSESSVCSLEIYDLTGNTSDSGSDYSQNIRIGFEQYLNEEIALRLGAHNLNSEVNSSKYLSFGLGWLRSNFFDAKQMNYFLDYTFIYWTDAIGTMEEYTHQLGFTVKF